MNFKKYLEKPHKKNSNFLLSPYFVNDKIQKEKEEEINKKTLEAIVILRESIENEEKEEKIQQEKELEKIKTEDIFNIVEPKKEMDKLEDLNILLQDVIEYSNIDSIIDKKIEKYMNIAKLENIEEENKKIKD
jgi:hypothetical protein